jgi:serine/threonine protein kinase
LQHPENQQNRTEQKEEIQQRVWSPPVIDLYEYFTEQKYYCQVLEYCLSGSFLPKWSGPRPNATKQSELFCQFLCSLQAFPACGISHFDIKLSNVLIDGYNRVKLRIWGSLNSAEILISIYFTEWSSSFRLNCLRWTIRIR